MLERLPFSHLTNSATALKVNYEVQWLFTEAKTKLYRKLLATVTSADLEHVLNLTTQNGQTLGCDEIVALLAYRRRKTALTSLYLHIVFGSRCNISKLLASLHINGLTLCIHILENDCRKMIGVKLNQCVLI